MRRIVASGASSIPPERRGKRAQGQRFVMRGAGLAIGPACWKWEAGAAVKHCLGSVVNVDLDGQVIALTQERSKLSSGGMGDGHILGQCCALAPASRTRGLGPAPAGRGLLQQMRQFRLNRACSMGNEQRSTINGGRRPSWAVGCNTFNAYRAYSVRGNRLSR